MSSPHITTPWCYTLVATAIFLIISASKGQNRTITYLPHKSINACMIEVHMKKGNVRREKLLLEPKKQEQKNIWRYNNYRLITAYLHLRVNLDKIMHARWDFDASSAQTRRVSALDKHQNGSASALFCLNSRAQSKYAAVNLIHMRHKQTFFFCLLLCDK